MNRDHEPCRECAKFLPTGGQKAHEDGPGRCEGREQQAHSTDRPCVLFVKRGSWAHRQSMKPPAFRDAARDQFARERSIPRKAETTKTTRRTTT